MKHRLVVACVLLLGALLRFHALSAGLRHRPSQDEAYFVENAMQMVRERDLDHRFYEYPGLFFYILFPFLALLGAREPAGPDSYLLARQVVAAFGVASLWLVYRLGARLASHRVGLAAAAFLAVSPVEVQTAHHVRPDVVLEFFALLALWAVLDLAGHRRAVLRAGFALGAAMAVKFSGILLVPSCVTAALRAPDRRFERLLVVLVTAGVVFLCLTPYALIHAAEFVDGAWTQVRHFYPQVGPKAETGRLERVARYAAVWPKALGTTGCVLALAGLWIAIKEWRLWLPLLIFPVTALAVFGTSPLKYDRQLLSTLGVLALLCGLAIERLARLRSSLAWATAAVALSAPLAADLDYLGQISRPSTLDRTLDWIEARVPEGSRILTTVQALGVDRTRFEVLKVRGVTRGTMPQVLDFDYVITTGWDDPLARAPLRLQFIAAPEGKFNGPLIVAHGVPEAARPRLVPVPLAHARLRASENEGLLNNIRDGRGDTWWQTAGPKRAGAWLQVDLDRSVLLRRIELDLGDARTGAARRLQLEVSEDGAEWRAVAALRGRPRPLSQIVWRRGASQVLLFDPVAARSLRLTNRADGTRPWRVARLLLFALPEPTDQAKRDGERQPSPSCQRMNTPKQVS